MTATRIGRVATLAVAALVWVLAASALWRTKVPADLHLHHLDPRAVFGAGAVNAGVITGVVVMTVLWAVSLPFGVANGWWERRHGISKESWGAIVFSPWQGLLSSTFTTVIVL